MSCNCKLYQRKLDKLQKKYATLKKNHKKLLGVTVVLTEALEKLVRREVKTEINDTLLTCSSIYPELFKMGNSENEGKDDLKIQSDDHFIPSKNDEGIMLQTATESDKEYYEGFMARPKIPRTPQV